MEFSCKFNFRLSAKLILLYFELLFMYLWCTYVYTESDPICIEPIGLLRVEKGPRSKAETQEEKWCNWRALIEELVMEVHSTGVQWPAPLQGPHLLICGSPLPGKYAPMYDNVSATLHLARGWVSAVVEFFSSHINYPISRNQKKIVAPRTSTNTRHEWTTHVFST